MHDRCVNVNPVAILCMHDMFFTHKDVIDVSHLTTIPGCLYNNMY